MTYELLSESVQLILVTNFEILFKLFLVLFILGLAFYYDLKGKYEDTLEYVFSREIKYLKMAVSKVVIFFLPFWFFLVFPQVAVDKILIVVIAIYGLAIPLIVIVLFVGLLYYGPVWVLRFSGMDLSRKADQGVLEGLDKMFRLNPKGLQPNSPNFRTKKKNS